MKKKIKKMPKNLLSLCQEHRVFPQIFRHFLSFKSVVPRAWGIKPRFEIKGKNAKMKQINWILLFVIVLAGVAGLITAFPIPGHPLSEIGCGVDSCDKNIAGSGKGVIDNADYATTAATATNAQKLDSLDSTAFCRSNGNNCPARDGTLSCKEVAGTQAVGTSTATCADDYEITGGGCYVEVQNGFKKAKKSGNGWICAAGNSAWKVTAYAVCCKII